MRATFEIIPHCNHWHKFWIFVAGCATGAAGAIGAILIKERTEVRDGCVIFRHEAKNEDKTPASESTVAPPNTSSEEGQGEGPEAGSDAKPEGDTPPAQ